MGEVRWSLSDITAERWREQAQCQHLDPHIFFPESRGADACDEAIAVCQGCPVRSQCLQHAQENAYTYGVWGGQLFQRDWGTHERHRT